MQEEGAGRPFLLHLQPRQRRLNTGDVFSGMGVPGEWQSHAGCKPFTGISAQSPTALHRARSGRTPWPSTVGASGTARQQDASTAHRAALGGTACISLPGTPRKNISACSHRVQSVIGACHHAHKHFLTRCASATSGAGSWAGGGDAWSATAQTRPPTAAVGPRAVTIGPRTATIGPPPVTISPPTTTVGPRPMAIGPPSTTIGPPPAAASPPTPAAAHAPKTHRWPAPHKAGQPVARWLLVCDGWTTCPSISVSSGS